MNKDLTFPAEEAAELTRRRRYEQPRKGLARTLAIIMEAANDGYANTTAYVEPEHSDWTADQLRVQGYAVATAARDFGTTSLKISWNHVVDQKPYHPAETPIQVHG